MLNARWLQASLPVGPQDRTVPTFRTADSEVTLQGEPLYVGRILQLTLGQSIHDMTLAMHANGFSLISSSPEPGEPATLTRAWSPFSLVEKCQVKTMTHSSYWAVFKLTVFRQEGHDRCFYFASTGDQAAQERDEWVERMSHIIGAVTISLFPAHAIAVMPVPGVAATSSRIMAGYLLMSLAQDQVQLLYSELCAYSQREARFTTYRDEWCDKEVFSMIILDSTTVSTRKGTYCTIFGLDQYRFCARTAEEKELWLRAVSNIKVKLMFEAPDPSPEELEIFRAAVQDRVRLVAKQNVHLVTSAKRPGEKPLLSEVVRLPPHKPLGDDWDPEPLEDRETAEEAQENVYGVPGPMSLPPPPRCFSGLDVEESPDRRSRPYTASAEAHADAFGLPEGEPADAEVGDQPTVSSVVSVSIGRMWPR